MKRRRVKITGIGLVTPAGIGRKAFVTGLGANTSYVWPIKRFPIEGGPFVASEVRRFNVSDYVDNSGANRLPRHTQFALAASRLAISDAGLTRDEVARLDPVLVTGTSLMDSAVINKTIENVALRGPRYALARVVFHGPVAAVSASIAEDIGGGRTLSLQSACCSGLDSIGQAADIVAEGGADIAVCGGTEAPIYYHPMLELRMAGLSPASVERPEQLGRPYDLWRTTGVIGEGACMVVLEPESSPRHGYALVDGYSFATDTSTSPGNGLTKAITLCLANAAVRPQAVDMINGWGPGHKEIDAMESQSLRRIFGNYLDQIPTVSIKGAIGNPFAAAGAIQVGCAALGLRYSFIPPTVNWQRPDPECRLNLANRMRLISFKQALVTAHGVSGTNSCILLSRCNST